MSEASERVEAWRREKRRAGYRPVMLWLRIPVKAELDALAYSRAQDLSACVEDAIHALASQGGKKPLRVDPHQEEELISKILSRLNGQAGATTTTAHENPASPPSSVKGGGKPGVPLATLSAICAKRRQHPDLPLAKLAQLLFDEGIYHSISRQTGQPVPAQGATIKQLLDKAVREGVL